MFLVVSLVNPSRRLSAVRAGHDIVRSSFGAWALDALSPAKRKQRTRDNGREGVRKQKKFITGLGSPPRNRRQKGMLDRETAGGKRDQAVVPSRVPLPRTLYRFSHN